MTVAIFALYQCRCRIYFDLNKYLCGSKLISTSLFVQHLMLCYCDMILLSLKSKTSTLRLNEAPHNAVQG